VDDALDVEEREKELGGHPVVELQGSDRSSVSGQDNVFIR
jgi:hypothetical protein